MAGHYFQPCSHLSASLSSCQSMGYSLRDSTASSTHDSTAPSSSYSTSVTKKCFSRLSGVTAVHLLLRSLAGLILCMSVPKFFRLYWSAMAADSLRIFLTDKNFHRVFALSQQIRIIHTIEVAFLKRKAGLSEDLFPDGLQEQAEYMVIHMGGQFAMSADQVYQCGCEPAEMVGWQKVSTLIQTSKKPNRIISRPAIPSASVSDR